MGIPFKVSLPKGLNNLINPNRETSEPVSDVDDDEVQMPVLHLNPVKMTDELRKRYYEERLRKEYGLGIIRDSYPL